MIEFLEIARSLKIPASSDGNNFDSLINTFIQVNPRNITEWKTSQKKEAKTKKQTNKETVKKTNV